jgi:ABC-type lipoprotein export system ATPase subunit
MNPLLEIRDLTKIYHAEQPVVALDHVNLTISNRAFIALTGPSGSGKSTLLNLIGALDSPTEGEILFEGQPVNTLSENELATFRRNKIGFVFQLFYLLPALTALENVMLPLLPFQHRIGFKLEKRAKELLGAVGLSSRVDHFPAQLSGGECQRVAVARALINFPRLLLADEPTGNLDSQNGAELIKLFKRLNRELDLAIFIVTHDAGIAGQADEQFHLQDGRLT